MPAHQYYECISCACSATHGTVLDEGSTTTSDRHLETWNAQAYIKLRKTVGARAVAGSMRRVLMLILDGGPGTSGRRAGSSSLADSSAGRQGSEGSAGEHGRLVAGVRVLGSRKEGFEASRYSGYPYPAPHLPEVPSLPLRPKSRKVQN